MHTVNFVGPIRPVRLPSGRVHGYSFQYLLGHQEGSVTRPTLEEAARYRSKCVQYEDHHPISSHKTFQAIVQAVLNHGQKAVPDVSDDNSGDND